MDIKSETEARYENLVVVQDNTGDPDRTDAVISVEDDFVLRLEDAEVIRNPGLVYRQEMAAIVCIFESGEITIASTHMTLHEARERLSEMQESGEADEWTGQLVLASGGVCHAEIDIEKLSFLVS